MLQQEPRGRRSGTRRRKGPRAQTLSLSKRAKEREPMADPGLPKMVAFHVVRYG